MVSGRGTNDAFDRAARGRRKGHRPDATGKEALFSTAPSSAPPPPLDVHCPSCDMTIGLQSPGDWFALVRPPFLVNPFRATVWNRCPSCGKRTWLEVSLGAGLRALLGHPSE